MATVQFSPLITGIHGRVGGVLFKQRGEKSYICRRPDFSKRKLSTAQQKSNKKFRLAVAYARGVLADPIARQPYEEMARERGKTVYNTIISEYLTAPGVQCAGAALDLTALIGHNGTRIQAVSDPRILHKLSESPFQPGRWVWRGVLGPDGVHSGKL